MDHLTPEILIKIDTWCKIRLLIQIKIGWFKVVYCVGIIKFAETCNKVL